MMGVARRRCAFAGGSTGNRAPSEPHRPGLVSDLVEASDQGHLIALEQLEERRAAQVLA